MFCIFSTPGLPAAASCSGRAERQEEIARASVLYNMQNKREKGLKKEQEVERPLVDWVWREWAL